MANPKRLVGLVLAGVMLVALIIFAAIGRAPAGMSVAAASFGTWDARANARMAELLVAQAMLPGATDRSASRSRARDLAHRVLERDLLVPQAWRIIGQTAEAEGKTSTEVYPYFRVADTVSRRDLPTQVWLTEYNIRKGNLAEGFRHFDLAMRQSTKARGLLMPGFTQAVSDPSVRKPLMEALVANVPWRSDFLLELGRTPPKEADLVGFIRALPDGVVKDEAANLRLVAANHVQRGLYAAARAITQRLGESGVLVRNGGFETPNASPPFDWELQSTSAYEAVQGAYAQGIEGKGALFLRIAPRTQAQLARQILFLDPGQYDVSVLTGPDSGVALDDLTLALACAGSDGQAGASLGVMSLAVGKARRKNAGHFAIPGSGCVAQWLTVSASSGEGTEDASAWLDTVTLARSGAPQTRARPATRD